MRLLTDVTVFVSSISFYWFIPGTAPLSLASSVAAFSAESELIGLTLRMRNMIPSFGASYTDA